MTLDEILELPGVRSRLLRAAAVTLAAQERSFRDFKQVSWGRNGDLISVLGDGRVVVSLELSALTARTDA